MDKLKKSFTFIGFVLAGLAAVAYLILLYIIIGGFEKGIETDKLLMFLIIGAIDGILINISLGIQGISFAKLEPAAVSVNEEYQELTAKDKDTKFRKLWVFNLFEILKDIFTKGATTVLSLYFTITIIIEGLGDFKYFFLGIVNVLLYLGFGFLRLVKSYDHYLENEVPLKRQKILKLKEDLKNEDDKRIYREPDEVGQGSGLRVSTEDEQGANGQPSGVRDFEEGARNIEEGSRDIESKLR